MSDNIVILGSGESGMGAASLAAKRGYETFLSDNGKISPPDKKELKSLGISCEEGKHSPDKILAAGLIVKSPGIPESVPVIQQAIGKGIPVISEIEFAFRHVSDKARVIAITGTNGKTTTTLIIHHLLKTAGLNAALAGNVGYSFAKKVAEKDYDYYVVEVSSFQLDGIVRFKPDVAILLNITPDHLDRYQNDFNAYVASKFRITENLTSDECFIYCSDDLVISDELSRRKVESCLFAISATMRNIKENGAFIDQEHLIFNFNFKNTERQHRIPISEIKLIGRHNMINIMAGVLSALVFDVSIDRIIKGLKSFKNAPHRLEFVEEINGVEFINDSKATNVESVYYALDGISKPIIWIAGGIDKGNDYSRIRELVGEKVKGIVCLGKDNRAIVDFFSPSSIDISETKSMKEAIRVSLNWSKPGDVVLLSPACASFDLFSNYEDRGDQFKTEVRSIGKNILETA